MDNSSEAFSKALDRYQTPSPRWSAILKSWREHPSKDDLWRAFQSAAIKQGKPLPEPADFIGVVLGATMPTKRLNDHNEHVLNRFKKLKREIGSVVDDADYPLDLWRDLQCFEKSLRELGQSAYDMRTPAGGRKDQNDSRDRQLFALRMFRYLKDSCGEYLSPEVTKMLNIVFPDDETKDDARMVRIWLAKISKPVV
jgi:hypothetical protein